MRWLFWWRPPCLLRRVIVNVTYNSTEAFEGVLWSCSIGGWCTLKDVSALTSGQPPAKILGDIVLHRAQIAYYQVAP